MKHAIALTIGTIATACGTSRESPPAPLGTRASAVRNGQPSNDARIGALYSLTPTVLSPEGEPSRCYLAPVYLASATLVNENVLITVGHNDSYGGEGLYFSTVSPAMTGDPARVPPPQAQMFERRHHRYETELGEDDGIDLIRLGSGFDVDPPTLDCDGTWEEDQLGRIHGYGRSASGSGQGTRRYGDQPFRRLTSHGNVEFGSIDGVIPCYGDSGGSRWKGVSDGGTVLSGIAYLGDYACDGSQTTSVDFPVARTCQTLRDEAASWRAPLTCSCGESTSDHIYTREGCGGRADTGPPKYAYYRETSSSCDRTPDYSGLREGQPIESGDGSSSWDFYDLCWRNQLLGETITLCEYDAENASYTARPVDCSCASRALGG